MLSNTVPVLVKSPLHCHHNQESYTALTGQMMSTQTPRLIYKMGGADWWSELAELIQKTTQKAIAKLYHGIYS